MFGANMLGGNAVRAHRDEETLYFGIRSVDSPDPELLALVDRRSTHTSMDRLELDVRNTYEQSGRSLQMTHVMGCLLKEFGHPQESTRMLEDAARRGFGPAMLQLGKRAFSASRYDRAVEYWTGACNANLGEGTCALARMYRDGLGVAQDSRRAAELYRKSSAEGYFEANNNLGTLLLSDPTIFPGNDGGLDLAGALEAYEKGLAADHTVCFISVADILAGRHQSAGLLPTLDSKTRKRVKSLARIAHARHDGRADFYMRRMRISPLPLRGRPQAGDDEPMSVTACAACLVKDTTELRKCAGCRTVEYCSVECQRADWEARHRTLCKKAGPSQQD